MNGDGLLREGGGSQLSTEVRPSRIAYVVSSATLCVELS
jgi:hypothetical protein